MEPVTRSNSSHSTKILLLFRIGQVNRCISHHFFYLSVNTASVLYSSAITFPNMSCFETYLVSRILSILPDMSCLIPTLSILPRLVLSRSRPIPAILPRSVRCPFLSCSILYCPSPVCQSLSFPSNPVLSCCFFPCPVCRVLSYLVSSCYVLSLPVLFCYVLPVISLSVRHFFPNLNFPVQSVPSYPVLTWTAMLVMSSPSSILPLMSVSMNCSSSFTSSSVGNRPAPDKTH